MLCSMCALGISSKNTWTCTACKEVSCQHIRLIDHSRTCPNPAIADKEWNT